MEHLSRLFDSMVQFSVCGCVGRIPGFGNLCTKPRKCYTMTGAQENGSLTRRTRYADRRRRRECNPGRSAGCGWIRYKSPSRYPSTKLRLMVWSCGRPHGRSARPSKMSPAMARSRPSSIKQANIWEMTLRMIHYHLTAAIIVLGLSIICDRTLQIPRHVTSGMRFRRERESHIADTYLVFPQAFVFTLFSAQIDALQGQIQCLHS